MQTNKDAEFASLHREALNAYSIRLLDNAAFYDLGVKTERTRSVADLDRLFFELVEVFQPDLFIEAGAKDGSASLRGREILDGARVVAFEANPYTHARFKHRFADPKLRVEYHHLALSETSGPVTFNVRLRHDGQPSADGRGSLMPEKDKSVRHQKVTVKGTALDEFFGETMFQTCALWIDVEGAQKAVLTGGPTCLTRASVVIVEVEDRPTRGQIWLRPAIEEHLFAAGLVPVARDFQARYLYNIVFVREALLNKDRCRWTLARHQSRLGTRSQSSLAARPAPLPNSLSRRLKLKKKARDMLHQWRQALKIQPG